MRKQKIDTKTLISFVMVLSFMFTNAFAEELGVQEDPSEETVATFDGSTLNESNQASSETNEPETSETETSDTGTNESGENDSNVNESESNEELTGVEGFVTRLYETVLGRSPDAPGFEHWCNLLLTGASDGGNVARSFLYSPEFLGTHYTDEEFLEVLYRTFFDREPDSVGLTTWLDYMYNNRNVYGDQVRSHVLENFINSQEWANVSLQYGICSGSSQQASITVESNDGVNRFVDALYNDVLGRNGDGPGIAGWTSRLANMQISGKECAYGFFYSPEFMMNCENLSDEEIIDIFYSVFLDRGSDEEGFQNWSSQIEGLSIREKIDILFNGFADSEEFKQKCLSYGIVANFVESTPLASPYVAALGRDSLGQAAIDYMGSLIPNDLTPYRYKWCADFAFDMMYQIDYYPDISSWPAPRYNNTYWRYSSAWATDVYNMAMQTGQYDAVCGITFESYDNDISAQEARDLCDFLVENGQPGDIVFFFNADNCSGLEGTIPSSMNCFEYVCGHVGFYNGVVNGEPYLTYCNGEYALRSLPAYSYYYGTNSSSTQYRCAGQIILRPRYNVAAFSLALCTRDMNNHEIRVDGSEFALYTDSACTNSVGSFSSTGEGELISSIITIREWAGSDTIASRRLFFRQEQGYTHTLVGGEWTMVPTSTPVENTYQLDLRYDTESRVLNYGVSLLNPDGTTTSLGSYSINDFEADGTSPIVLEVGI